MEPKRHAVSRKGAKAQSPKWNELSFFFASFAPLRGMLLFLLVALTAAAQQVGQNATPEANGHGHHPREHAACSGSGRGKGQERESD